MKSVRKINVGILFGGKSDEHEVSCMSAYNIYDNIDREKFEPYLIGVTREGQFRYFFGEKSNLLTNWENFSKDNTIDIINDKGFLYKQKSSE